LFSATADAQICAKEEADADSSDDEQGINYKRSSNGANNRKRRAVFDFSDDEDENVVGIAFPERSAQLVPNPVTEASEDTKENQKKLESKQDKTSVGDCSKGMDSDFFPEHKVEKSNTMKHSGITLKEKSSDPPINNNKQDQPASTSPKRRKVLKTRIDERGREGIVVL
jgi:DNA polymerase delta subunit 3